MESESTSVVVWWKEDLKCMTEKKYEWIMLL